jgi:hypothetical protein
VKFFVPHAKDEAQARRVYEASKKFCEDQTGWRILPKKISALRYLHDGREYLAAVGSSDYSEGEVLCIFESEVTFFVCTADRGVLRGFPILVGREEVSDIEYFDAD